MMYHYMIYIASFMIIVYNSYVYIIEMYDLQNINHTYIAINKKYRDIIYIAIFLSYRIGREFS